MVPAERDVTRLLVAARRPVVEKPVLPTGLCLVDLDETTGALDLLGVSDEGAEPWFLAAGFRSDRVYATLEPEDPVPGQSKVVEYEVRGDGSGDPLRRVAEMPSGGKVPCHLAVDPTEALLLVANYHQGSVSSFSLNGRGSLGECRAVLRHEGSGPDPRRQEAPHPHMVVVDPRVDAVFVPDLGLDRIVGYRIRDGNLYPAPELDVDTPARSGPRHGVWHPDGHHLFVITELDPAVISLRWDGVHLRPVNRVPLSRPGGQRISLASSLNVHPSGQFIFAANRGEDVVCVLDFDGSTSTLSLRHRVVLAGANPRDAHLTPSGEVLIVADEDSNTVTSYLVNIDGALTLAARLALSRPVCVITAPPGCHDS